MAAGVMTYEYEFGIYDALTSSAFHLQEFVSKGGWRIAHVTALSDSRVLITYERGGDGS